MKKTLLMAPLVIVMAMLCVMPALAESYGLTVDPAVIKKGDSIKITLTTDRAATGTLVIIDPSTTKSWTASISIGAGGGSQSWTFPTDFAGADTNTIGSYDVEATVLMGVGKLEWRTKFMVEFFVIPELTFGTVMATLVPLVAMTGLATKRKLKL